MVIGESERFRDVDDAIGFRLGTTECCDYMSCSINGLSGSRLGTYGLTYNIRAQRAEVRPQDMRHLA